MEENTNNQEVKNEELTPEQAAKLREDTITFYKESNEMLSLQAEFEELNSRIAQAKLNRIAAIMQIAHITQPSKEEKPKEEKPKEQNSRHLKH